MKVLFHPKQVGSRASILAWLAAFMGAMVFLVLAVAVGLAGILRPSREVANLRETVWRSSPDRWEKEIELGVGPVILGLARAGLAFVDLEPEVRTALRAVRAASVGIYRLEGTGRSRDGAVWMEEVDARMTRRGWERALAVLDGHECVMAYVPAKIRSTENLKVCVLVLEGEQMVVTSVRANPKPLMELLLREANRACAAEGFVRKRD